MEATPKLDAFRVWNSSRTTAKVIVVLPDGRERKLGGNRAARAGAAIVTERTIEGGARVYGVIGLRADVNAAEADAARLLKPFTRYGANRPSQYSNAFAVIVRDVPELSGAELLAEAREQAGRVRKLAAHMVDVHEYADARKLTLAQLVGTHAELFPTCEGVTA